MSVQTNGRPAERPAPGRHTSNGGAGWSALTAERPPGSGPAGRRTDGLLPVKRTMLALLASGLGVFPLKGLLSDNGWLLDAWLTMLVAVVPAALVRLRRPPGALDIWPGIILLVPWLTARFVPKHAWHGFIPTSGTWHDVTKLINHLHHTTRVEVAPIHSTVAVRLVVCALLGLLAALIDLIAVVGRRGALAGVPLLVIYTVSGAVPRDAVAWPWFVLAAVAFLILLALDAGDDMRSWGRHIAPPAGVRSRPVIAVSAPRIAAAAVVAAVLLPVLVPSHPRNLIADAFHNGHSGGSGTGGISPYTRFTGELRRPDPQNLFRVHISPKPGNVQPFYLRLNVLESYTNDVGWGVGDHGGSQGLDLTNFDTDPPSTLPADAFRFRAQLTILKLHGTSPPVFDRPLSLTGTDGETNWSPQDHLLLDGDVHTDQVITEDVAQPDPTKDELTSASGGVPTDLSRDLTVPGDLPTYVRDLVARLTRHATTPYAKARAISDYFTNPANGFFYSLKTPDGDSGSALVDFLKNRQGFCQQYAGAMGIMLRVAGVPTRVVLGYEHTTPDPAGNFIVTTDDAHSWVEAYFAGLGWVPFDPTPIDGLAGGPANDLGYAPHQAYSGGVPNDANSNARGNTNLTQGLTKNNTAAPSGVGGGGSGQGGASLATALGTLLVVLVVLVLLLVPAALRFLRRRRRMLAARHGDADALWAELSDTAIDLGYVWSPARSPRQVATWLSRDAPTAAPALRELASAVERSRYAVAPAGREGSVLAGDLRTVTGALRAQRSNGTRLRAALWPASLGWGRLPGRAIRRR